MRKAFESIMRGLGEVKAHREGKFKLKTTVARPAGSWKSTVRTMPSSAGTDPDLGRG